MCFSGLLMGYGPLIDRDRRILALQLRFSSLDGRPLNLSFVYEMVAGDRPIQGQTLLISAPWADFDPGMGAIEPVPGLWIEVPAWVAEQPAHQAMLLGLHERGMGLVLQGRPSINLGATVADLSAGDGGCHRGASPAERGASGCGGERWHGTAEHGHRADWRQHGSGHGAGF